MEIKLAILLDTSFIIALDNINDVHHKKARELWEKIEKEKYGKAFISDYIFDELIAVTSRKINKERAIILCEQILKSIPIVNIDRHMFDESWNFFKETKTNLNFTDCTNLVLLSLLGSNKLATFDKGFNGIKDLEIVNV